MFESMNKAYIESDFGKPQDKKRNFARIKSLFNLAGENKYTIDDQTWDDLTMDDVFSKIDMTYSGAGEAALYTLLRNPMMNEEKLKNREDLMNLFIKDRKLTTKLRLIFFNLGIDRKNRLIEMLQDGMLKVNKSKYYIYLILGRVIPLLILTGGILFQQPTAMIVLLVAMFVNIFINEKESKNVRAAGIKYLGELLTAGNKICKIENEELASNINRIKDVMADLKKIDRGIKTIKFFSNFGFGLMEAVSIPLLMEESTYYNISGELKEKDSKILELYYLIGEIDALIGMASYKYSNKDRISTPVFVEDETKLTIKNGIHPLLKNPVANTVEFNNKGIVLTGTNMSGKSTFLRMVSVNILLAQSFYFTLSKGYEASFLNIVSSISPKDDIKNGKSYYLAEAECILRIIKALDNDIPVFCPIDEIFRGTNPIERISSSAEILNYINDREALCIVATHDRELTEMLKTSYQFFYFSEDVSKNKGLSFDYKLKEGVSKTRNAIKLLEYIGYPKEIIKKSYKRSEAMENYM